MRLNRLKLIIFKKLNKIDNAGVWSSNHRWKKSRLNGKSKQKLLLKLLKSKSDSNIFKKDYFKKVSIHQLRLIMELLLLIYNPIFHSTKIKNDIFNLFNKNYLIF